MTKRRKAQDLQVTIEDELVKMFNDETVPDDGRMKLVKLGIAYLAVKNKLEENEYGEFFDGDAGGVPEEPARQKPAARRRENGAGSGAGVSET